MCKLMATARVDTEFTADPMESSAVKDPEQSSAMPSSAQIEPAVGPACVAEERTEKHIRVTATVFEFIGVWLYGLSMSMAVYSAKIALPFSFSIRDYSY